MIIRRANPPSNKKDDCRACETISKQCKELINANGKADYYDWFLEYLRMGQIILVAEHRNKIVGFIAGEINTGYALIHLLAVNGKMRGKGIGGKLISEFERECSRRGITCVLLYGYKDRSDFFLRQGYIRGSPCFEFMKVIHKEA